MANRTKWTARKEQTFLTKLAATGNVTEACEAVDLTRSSAYARRAELPDFSTAWDDVVSQYAETLEREADRRAVEGSVRDVYYQGVVVGQERQYSDTLLMFRLKKLDPNGYRERIQQQLTGDEGGAIQVNVTHNVVRRGDV